MQWFNSTTYNQFVFLNNTAQNNSQNNLCLLHNCFCSTTFSTFLSQKGQVEYKSKKLAFSEMSSLRTLALSISVILLVGITLYLCSRSLIKFLDYPTFMGSAFEDQRTGNFPDLTFCLHRSHDEEEMNKVFSNERALEKTFIPSCSKWLWDFRPKNIWTHTYKKIWISVVNIWFFTP